MSSGAPVGSWGEGSVVGVFDWVDSEGEVPVYLISKMMTVVLLVACLPVGSQRKVLGVL